MKGSLISWCRELPCALLLVLAGGFACNSTAYMLSTGSDFLLSGEPAGSRQYRGPGQGTVLSIDEQGPPGSKNIDPLGLVSLAMNVAPHTQAWVDELQMANLGVMVQHGQLHSVFTVGALYAHPDLTWSLGYGLGKHIPLSRFSLNVDALAQLINVQRLDPHELDLVTRLRFSAEWHLNDNMKAFAGISWNNLRLSSSDPPTCPEWRSESARGGRTWKSRWPGFFVGLQF